MRQITTPLTIEEVKYILDADEFKDCNLKITDEGDHYAVTGQKGDRQFTGGITKEGSKLKDNMRNLCLEIWKTLNP